MAQGTCPVARLGDDLAVEILSRLPVRSLYRSKCVSTAWRNLIAHPDHGRRLPQTLAGFFFYSNRSLDRSDDSPALDFTTISGNKGRPWSLAFLPDYLKGITLLDCCNGLLLCSIDDDGSRYAVCNPATEKWVALPCSIRSKSVELSFARLCFDPALSSHFHVIEFVDDAMAGVEVYSSKTGEWAHEEGNGWKPPGDARLTPFSINLQPSAPFLKGCLHFLGFPAATSIDAEGKTWREIPIPDYSNSPPCGSLHLSQGRLHYISFRFNHHGISRLVVYVLDDYGSQRWTLKHSAETQQMFGGEQQHDDVVFCHCVTIHPECDLIFFTVGYDRILMSYDMDRRRVQSVCDLGHHRCRLCLPYVPSYVEFAHVRSTGP